jgi:hypothetical protein
MADLGCETLPVGENNRLVGTITGCDIALQVAAAGRDPAQTMVRQAMSADVLYCYASESARCFDENARLVGPAPPRCRS